MRLPIPWEIKVLAYELERCMLASNKIREKHNYTNFNSERKFYKSYLGELMVAEILKKQNKDIRYECFINDMSDNGDFFVKRQGEVKSIDLKTSANETGRKFCLTGPQVRSWKDRNKIPDVLLGAKIYTDHSEDWEWLEVMGWATLADFTYSSQLAQPDWNNYYFLPYQNTNKFGTLIKQLDPGSLKSEFYISPYILDRVGKIHPLLRETLDMNKPSAILD